MHEQTGVAVPQPIAANKEPLLKDFGSRFSNVNDVQCKLLGEIEGRLHDILNNRGPQDPAKDQVPNISDFASMADLQIRRLVEQNDRLDRILSHLSKII